MEVVVALHVTADAGGSCPCIDREREERKQLMLSSSSVIGVVMMHWRVTNKSDAFMANVEHLRL